MERLLHEGLELAVAKRAYGEAAQIAYELDARQRAKAGTVDLGAARVQRRLAAAAGSAPDRPWPSPPRELGHPQARYLPEPCRCDDCLDAHDDAAREAARSAIR